MTAEGIVRVTGDRMQYEVIPVDPPVVYGQGLTPATVAGGFGSTTTDGVATGPYWIQSYERRE